MASDNFSTPMLDKMLKWMKQKQGHDHILDKDIS